MSVYAQPDNLEPEDGYLSCHQIYEEYYIDLKKILFENLSYYTYARAIVIPSFGKAQSLVSIDSAEGSTYLTYRILKRQVRFDKKDTNRIVFREYKMKLDTSLTNRLQELFFLATSNVRYPEEPYYGSDGVTYIFMSSKQFYGTRCGKIWSPKGGRLYGLVQITDWLAKCGERKEIIDKDKMKEKVDGLIESFRKK